jgi:small subunit ribosomal protein S17
VAEKKPAAKKVTRPTRRTAAAAPRTRTSATARPGGTVARTTRRRAVATKPAKATKPAAPAWQRSGRRTLVGVVVTDRTPRTVVIEVARLRQHPLYKKVVRVRRRIPTHDQREEAKLGDIVRIEESRPFSATKRFQVVEVLSRAGEAREAAPEVAEVASALEAAEGVVEVLPRKAEDKEDQDAQQQREGAE